MTDHIATALIGCGQWGRNHARTLAEFGALAAVCDADAAIAAAVAEAHGVQARSFEAILNDAAIGALVLALPAERNMSMTCTALAAGKHVLVEKPIALTCDDATTMVDAARAAGRVLMVGHVLRYHGAFAALFAAIEAGRIGRVRHIQSHRLGFGKFYDRFDALWDLAPHDLSLILALADDGPSRVEITTASLTGASTDLAHVHLGFDAGTSAHVFVSRHSAYDERRFVVTGDSGSLIWDDLADWPEKLRLVPHHAERDADGVWQWRRGDAEPIPLRPSMALTNELAHFFDCAATGAEPLTSGVQGRDVVRVLERGGR